MKNRTPKTVRGFSIGNYITTFADERKCGKIVGFTNNDKQANVIFKNSNDKRSVKISIDDLLHYAKM